MKVYYIYVRRLVENSTSILCAWKMYSMSECANVSKARNVV